MKPKHRRLWMLALCALLVSGGAALVLYSFSSHLVYFYTPSQWLKAAHDPGTTIRLGGMVKLDSVERTGEQSIRFIVTDLTSEVTVRYTGIVPGLFREGQGVVAQGAFDTDGTFTAHTILAKHDENYMPPEVVKALQESGRWQHYSDENKKVFGE